MMGKATATISMAVWMVSMAPAANALDVAPASPSTQINQTLPTPTPQLTAPAPSGPSDRPSIAGPTAANAGAVVVIPLGRQRGETNGAIAPYSRRDSDSDGIPNVRDSRPNDPDRQ